MVVDISDDFLFFNVKLNILVQRTKNLPEQFSTQTTVKIHVRKATSFSQKALLIPQLSLLKFKY